MNKTDFLSDDYVAEGKSEKEFRDLLRRVDNSTVFLTQSMENICLLTPLPKEEQKADGKIRFYLFSPKEPQVHGRFREYAVEADKFKKKEGTQELLNEALETGQFLLYIDGEYAFVSKEIYKTLAQRVGTKLDAIRENSVERDVYLARMFNKPDELTMVCRTYGGAGKVFAVLGPSYSPNKLSILCSVRDIIGREKDYSDIECVRWSFCHEKAKILFSFPSLGKKLKKEYGLQDTWMPCLEMSTSDIGQGSFVAKGAWLVNGSLVYDKHEYIKENRGEGLDAGALAQNVIKDVLENYGRLPEKLAELSKKQIVPAGVEGDAPVDDALLKKSETKSRWTFWNNADAITDAIAHVYEHAQMTSSIGLKRRKELELHTFGKTDVKKVYTAYDIVLLCTTVVDSFAESVSRKEKLKFTAEAYRRYAESTAEMPYTDFTVKIKGKLAYELKER